MNNLRRRIMMQQGGGSILPPEYQQVDYLICNGNGNNGPCIKLLYFVKAGTEIESVWACGQNIPDYFAVFGIDFGGIYMYAPGVFAPPDGRIFFDWNYSRYYHPTPVTPDDFYTTKMVTTSSGASFYINDNLVSSVSRVVSVTSTKELGFLCMYDGHLIHRFNGKIRYAKVSENGETKLELYPCYRKLDGEPGIYDLTNDVFYTNAGNGSFIVGPDV